MDESLKDTTKRFAEQHYSMFGEIVVTSRAKRSPQKTVATAPEEPASASPFRDILSQIPEEWANATSLESLEQMISTCQKCPLGQTRTKFVFGVGNPGADIVVIGEAPGADEDRTGEPFVGLAGQLLNKILGAINLRREDVYIANILKSRPPGNRTPERFEVEQCIPYLLKQLEIIRPKFILALGLTAANTLLGRKAKMGELRGEVHDYYGIKVVVTYHPAALLRNPQWKRPTWEDVQMLRRMYDESGAGS
jgi:uracil-DNA glycosylase family 4